MCTERVITKNKMIFVHQKKKKNNKETQKFYKKQIDQSVRNSHVEQFKLSFISVYLH